MHEIGPATAEDVICLPDIERRASALFASWPATAHLPQDVTPLDDFVAAYREGLLWVARSGNAVIGFALVERLGDGLHLEELDVLPEHGRKGVGRALLREVCARSAAEQRVLSLCTFADVPWNAPFYERMGFRPLRREELWPALAHRVDEEAARGLATCRRVAMKLPQAPAR